MINYYTVSLLIGSITALCSGLFVYVKNRTALVSKTFLGVAITSSIWSAGYLGMITATTKEASWYFNWVLHAAAILIPAFFTHFSLALIKEADRHRRTLIFAYAVSILFLLVNPTRLFVQEMKPKFIFNYCCDAGPMYILFAIDFFGWVVFSLYKIYHASRRRTGVQSLQLKYALLASTAGFIGGGSVFFITFNMAFPPYLLILFALYPVLTAYAIVRYNLMDMTVVLTRAGIFLVVYAMVLGVPFWLGYTTKLWLPSTAMAVFFASAGPFIYTYFKRKAENRLLYEQKRYQKTLLQASQGMLLIKDLDALLKLIVHLLTRSIGLNHAFIYLQDTETNCYALKARRMRKKLDITESIPIDGPVVAWLNKHKRPLLFDEASFTVSQENEKGLVPALKCLSASVIVPAFVQENLMGFLVLGNKLSGAVFTQDDLGVFQVLANQAALAIENAIFYQETGKSLTQQFHEHRLRSIGKMGSYMGHQINNRFHAILNRAEEALHLALKKLRQSSLTDEQLQHLDRAEAAVLAIEENAKRGGGITERLTSFSRKETVLKPLPLADVVKATLELLSCRFKVEELNLKVDIEESGYTLYGDMAQLQDIFFNLLDNAHDAQQLKKQQQPDFTAQTTVSARIESGLWHIRISDNGAGMSKEQVDQLFLPFFSTKATTEKGTGIGLAVIKMMVENHRGKIYAESLYGEGTIFHIMLPATNQKEQA